jgi:hypothetical protein
VICSSCQRSGYGFQKVDGKAWCGCCSSPGTRTIGQTLSEGNTFYGGRTGPGSVAGLPPLIPIHEWQEVIRLCRRVSNRRLLTEDGPIKTLPLPTAKNPFDGPDRSGWQTLDEYYKQPPKPKTGNPYGFTPLDDFFKPESKTKDLDHLKRLMEG